MSSSDSDDSKVGDDEEDLRPATTKGFTYDNEEEDSSATSDEEEGIEDQERMKKEFKGFIVDEDEDESGSGSSSGSSSEEDNRKRKKKKKREKRKKKKGKKPSDDEKSDKDAGEAERDSSDADVLDDEDFLLIQENVGISLQRKKKRNVLLSSDDEENEGAASSSQAARRSQASIDTASVTSSKRKHPDDLSQRRKDIAREIFDEDDLDDEDEEAAQPTSRGKSAGSGFAKANKRSKVDVDDDLSSVADSERMPRLPTFPVPNEEEDEYSEDEMDDFIVDETGQPVQRRRAKKTRNMHTDATLQAAQDVFGVDLDYDEFCQMGEYNDDEGDDEDLDEEDEEDDEDLSDDEDGGASRRSHRSSKFSKARVRRRRRRQVDVSEMNEYFDPSEIERGFYSKEDQLIREADMPERFQTRHQRMHWIRENSSEYEKEVSELAEEASWIYHHAFQRGGGYITAQELVADTVTAVQDNLGKSVAPYQQFTHFRSRKSNEIIANIKHALSFMHEKLLEVPFIAFYRKEYVEHALDINDLWQVYMWDEKWWALRERRHRLLRLMERMLVYLRERIQLESETGPEAAPTVDGRMFDLLENDIALCRYADSGEEVHDIHQHFHLHFEDEMPKFLLWEKMKALNIKKHVRTKREPGLDDSESLAESRADDQSTIHEDADDEEGGFNEERFLAREKMKVSSRIRRRLGGRLYSEGKRANLLTLVEKFGLSATQFGENIRDQYQRHEVSQFPTLPFEAATDYMRPPFLPTETAVLQVARVMLACEIAHDPNVVKTVRRAMEERAKISITPTKKGREEIDESHPLYSVRYLRDKPINELHGDLFLYIDKAQRDKLLTYTLDMDHTGPAVNQVGTYVQDITPFFQKDEFSEVAKAWNEQRANVLTYALQKFLYPKLLKELRSKLLRESYEGILKICRRKMFNYLKVAPYPSEDRGSGGGEYEEDSDDEDMDMDGGGAARAFRRKGRGMCARVMALSYEEMVGPHVQPGNFLTMGVVLDSWGLPGEHVKMMNILRSANSQKKEHRDARSQDVQRVREFIQRHRPAIIIIGAESRSALMLQETLQSVVSELEAERLIPQPIPIHLTDNEPSLVYASSSQAQTEFPDYPKLLRQAISLGRRLQDPLLELAHLVNFDRDILNLRMHVLQEEVPKDMLQQALEIEFINRVNEVGVDVNRCLQLPHTANVIQFVAGLGPRKGFAMLKNFQRANRLLHSRLELVEYAQLTPHVIINCAAFIKVDPLTLGMDADQNTRDGGTGRMALDRTRIHPESYPLAGKMAIDAMDTEEQDFGGDTTAAVEEIIQAPEKLRELDLDAFAEELKRKGHGDKRTTLYDIRMELTHRYKDFRQPYRPPNAEERFQMITKETPATFHLGSLITCQIVRVVRRPPKPDQLENANPIRSEVTGLWVCPFCQQDDFPELSNMWSHFDAEECPGEPVGLHCILDNGVTGFLPTRLLSDSKVSNIFERVEVGMSIQARVTKLDIEKFRVELTSKSSDLRDDMNRWRPSRDASYAIELEERDMAEARAKLRQRQGPRYSQRMIFHPLYRNISYTQFSKMVKGMNLGDIVIRPSSKGPDHLTVSWKVDEGIVQHIDVLELDKPNAFTLGRTLRIGEEDFEDLDEIIARFVQPMANYVREVMDFKYYTDTEGGQKEMMNGILYREKAMNRARIPYFLTTTKQYPGKFILFYLPNTRLRMEYITVTPNGLRFRERMFDTVQRLLDWFKMNWNNAT